MTINALDSLVQPPPAPRPSRTLAVAIGHVLDWIEDSYPHDDAAGTLAATRISGAQLGKGLIQRQ